MRLFRIDRDRVQDGKAVDYWIEAHRPCGLPAVACPTCGRTWMQSGIIYPDVEVSSVCSAVTAIVLERPATPAMLDDVRAAIRPFVPAEAPLPPGTKFGRLRGKAVGRRFGQLAWFRPSVPLAREETLVQLERAGVRLPPVSETELVVKAPEPFRLWELNPPPVLELVRPIDAGSKCACCGWTLGDSYRQQKRVFRMSSVPCELDLFRPREGPGWILATEHCVRVMVEQGFVGTKFDELALV